MFLAKESELGDCDCRAKLQEREEGKEEKRVLVSTIHIISTVTD
jgi:hypothetical protein